MRAVVPRAWDALWQSCTRTACTRTASAGIRAVSEIKVLTQSFALSMYSEFTYSHVIIPYLYNRSRFPCIPSSRNHRIPRIVSAFSVFPVHENKLYCTIIKESSHFHRILRRASYRESFLLSGLHGDSRRIEKSFSIGIQEASAAASTY